MARDQYKFMQGNLIDQSLVRRTGPLMKRWSLLGVDVGSQCITNVSCRRIVVWGFGYNRCLHIAHSSTYVAACRDSDKRQAVCWEAETGIFSPPHVSISCLLLAHLLTGRKRSLLRLSGVGLKMEKSHLVSWQLPRPSGDTDLEQRQR